MIDLLYYNLCLPYKISKKEVNNLYILCHKKPILKCNKCVVLHKNIFKYITNECYFFLTEISSIIYALNSNNIDDQENLQIIQKCIDKYQDLLQSSIKKATQILSVSTKQNPTFKCYLINIIEPISAITFMLKHIIKLKNKNCEKEVLKCIIMTENIIRWIDFAKTYHLF